MVLTHGLLIHEVPGLEIRVIWEQQRARSSELDAHTPGHSAYMAHAHRGPRSRLCAQNTGPHGSNEEPCACAYSSRISFDSAPYPCSGDKSSTPLQGC